MNTVFLCTQEWRHPGSIRVSCAFDEGHGGQAGAARVPREAAGRAAEEIAGLHQQEDGRRRRLHRLSGRSHRAARGTLASVRRSRGQGETVSTSPTNGLSLYITLTVQILHIGFPSLLLFSKPSIVFLTLFSTNNSNFSDLILWPLELSISCGMRN